MKRFTLTPQYFGSMVFDRESCRYFPFDSEATDLLKSLATGNGYQSRRPLGPSDAELAFVDAFFAAGFLGLDGKFECDIQTTVPIPGNLTGPLAVHLEVSRDCNLSCRHCFADLGSTKVDPLSLEELDSLFSELSRMGSFRLGVTGGEPFLRPDLLEIVDAALSHGLHPCITTNGTYLTRELAQDLGKRNPLWLNVSLEGPTSRENDSVRGAGVFDRVMAQLDCLAGNCEFALCFTVTRRNFDRVEECVRLSENVGASTAVFRPLYPVGSALDNMELMPTFEMYREALRILSELDDCHYHVLDGFSPEAKASSTAGFSDMVGCGAGKSVCSISLSGDVSPCSFLGDQQVVGNVRGQDFAGLWNTYPGFRKFRQTKESQFRGGCRLRALKMNGSIDMPDPWFDQWHNGRNG